MNEQEYYAWIEANRNPQKPQKWYRAKAIIRNTDGTVSREVDLGMLSLSEVCIKRRHEWSEIVTSSFWGTADEASAALKAERDALAQRLEQIDNAIKGTKS